MKKAVIKKIKYAFSAYDLCRNDIKGADWILDPLKHEPSEKPLMLKRVKIDTLCPRHVIVPFELYAESKKRDFAIYSICPKVIKIIIGPIGCANFLDYLACFLQHHHIRNTFFAYGEMNFHFDFDLIHYHAWRLTVAPHLDHRNLCNPIFLDPEFHRAFTEALDVKDLKYSWNNK